MSNVTKRPWRIDPVVSTLIVGTEDPMPIICDTEAASPLAVETDAANAAHIVKAVNMHEEMLEALKAAIRQMDYQVSAGVSSRDSGMGGLALLFTKLVAKAEGRGE